MKKLTTLIIFTVLIGFSASVVMSIAKDQVIEVERSGIKLQVPQQYLYENRFPWIDEVTGLDSDDNSFLIKIPASEITRLLPPEVSQGELAPIDLTVIVYLLSPAEKQVMQRNRQTTFDEIVQRQPYFQKAYEEPDVETGWYRIYQSPKLTSRWYIFSDAPYFGERLVDVDSLIAICWNDEHIGRTCGVFTRIFNDVAIEMSLKYEHLPYYKDIQNHVVGLLNSWRR